MQAVDILGHDHLDLGGRFEFGDSPVNRVGPGGTELLVVLPLLPPVGAAGIGRRHEVLIEDRAPGLPHALGSAEVGDPAGRRDARSGEDQDASGVSNQVG